MPRLPLSYFTEQGGRTPTPTSNASLERIPIDTGQAAQAAARQGSDLANMGDESYRQSIMGFEALERALDAERKIREKAREADEVAKARRLVADRQRFVRQYRQGWETSAETDLNTNQGAIDSIFDQAASTFPVAGLGEKATEYVNSRWETFELSERNGMFSHAVGKWKSAKHGELKTYVQDQLDIAFQTDDPAQRELHVKDIFDAIDEGKNSFLSGTEHADLLASLTSDIENNAVDELAQEVEPLAAIELIEKSSLRPEVKQRGIARARAALEAQHSMIRFQQSQEDRTRDATERATATSLLQRASRGENVTQDALRNAPVLGPSNTLAIAKAGDINKSIAGIITTDSAQFAEFEALAKNPNLLPEDLNAIIYDYVRKGDFRITSDDYNKLMTMAYATHGRTKDREQSQGDSSFSRKYAAGQSIIENTIRPLTGNERLSRLFEQQANTLKSAAIGMYADVVGDPAYTGNPVHDAYRVVLNVLPGLQNVLRESIRVGESDIPAMENAINNISQMSLVEFDAAVTSTLEFAKRDDATMQVIEYMRGIISIVERARTALNDETVTPTPSSSVAKPTVKRRDK
jgi:hypothetical protein